jgi:hypothetical protein
MNCGFSASSRDFIAVNASSCGGDDGGANGGAGTAGVSPVWPL